MAWTCTVRLDEDKDTVGTATAVWDEGGPAEFSYSRRVKITMAEGHAFAEEAIAARDAFLQRRTDEANLSSTLEDIMADEEASS